MEIIRPIRLITHFNPAWLISTLGALLTMYSNTNYYHDYVKTKSWEQQWDGSTQVFDFIVVGGGSAGAVMANRLSKHNSVLLLELGGNPNPVTGIPAAWITLEKNPGIDLMYETAPQMNSSFGLNNEVVLWPRGVGLGGSSNINALIYQRGNPNDYDNWANITKNSEWSYKNLLPFFKKLEDYDGIYPNDEFHSKGGPIHAEKARETYMGDYMLKAAKEKGYNIGDTNSRQMEGFSFMELTTKKGIRWGTFSGYIKTILNRKNLHIYRYSRVVKIHLDMKKHAYGVTYYRHGKEYFVRARKEIILSAGAIDSAKILLLSGIGPKPHINSLGLKCRLNLPVGQNLQDHPFTIIGPFLVDSDEPILLENYINLKSAQDFVLNGQGLGVINFVTAIGYITTPIRNDSSWPDIQYNLVPINMSPIFAYIWQRFWNLKSEVIERSYKPYFDHSANFVIQTLVRPKSIGQLYLASRNPFVDPIIESNYFNNEEDVNAMIYGAKILVDIFENTTTYKKINARLAPIECEHKEFKSDAYYDCIVRQITTTLYHPVGTVTMGKDLNDTRAVLDSELRVLKSSGLRVIDASVMPVIINANTNIPTIMIGEVGSYFIRRYWAIQYEICPSQYYFYYYFSTQNMCFYSRLI